MERQSFLGLAAQVHDASDVELETQHGLVTAPQGGLAERLEQPIEKEKVLILRIIWHYNQKPYDPLEYPVHLHI